eukprot:scaffold8005_cov275-Amphora_coffeaeformis.AAC.6
MTPNKSPSTVKMRYPPITCVPAPKSGKDTNSMAAKTHSRYMCAAGNLRWRAPNRPARACRNDLTVSYTVLGTPTLVMYMIDSRGSSEGRAESNTAGSAWSFFKSSVTYL